MRAIAFILFGGHGRSVVAFLAPAFAAATAAPSAAAALFASSVVRSLTLGRLGAAFGFVVAGFFIR